ncbi:21983_t:CDS:2, partial [Gigaspora rosea]
RLVLPEEYKLLENIINRVKLKNRLLLEANTVIFDTIENSKLAHDNKQQLQNLRIKKFTFFSYQVVISLIVDTENRFALRRQILADQYLDESLRKKLMDQFDEKIIPICLNIEPDQPQLYPQEYLQINNFIDTITFENYQDLLVDGSIDHMIRNSQLQINEADHEQDLLELRNELSNDKILPSDLKNNLIQMIDKRIADEFDL